MNHHYDGDLRLSSLGGSLFASTLSTSTAQEILLHDPHNDAPVGDSHPKTHIADSVPVAVTDKPRLTSRPSRVLVPRNDGTPGMRPLRVLFIHGFESGPQGRRSVALGRHFETLTPWMRNELEPLTRWRRNRVVHACIALLVFLIGLTLLAAYVTHRATEGGLLATALALLLGPVIALLVVRQAVIIFVARPAILACLRKQRAAILSFEPDVVIGSSWGGGIATYLMMEGAWRGPTILLAPAGGLISRYAGYLSSGKLHIPSSVSYVHVVHSTRDRIVPAKDSVALVERSRCHQQQREGVKEEQSKSAERIKLTIVDDDDHPLSKTMRENRLREAVLEAISFTSPTPEATN